MFQARLVSENVSSDSTLAFIGSTTVSFVPFGALLNGRIIRRIGTRNSAVLGSASISLGLLLNGWASKSVAGLVITNGLILGFGVGMTFMVCINADIWWSGQANTVYRPVAPSLLNILAAVVELPTDSSWLVVVLVAEY